MRVLGYFITVAVYVALLLWTIDKRNPEVEASPRQNEVRTRVEDEVRSPVSKEPKVLVRVRP